MAADMEKIETILMENEERLEKTLSVFKSELLMVRVGRANPHVLDKVVVDFYGTPTPINQVGNLSVTEGRCLVIAPWDASMLKVIEKQLLVENLGITPANDGKVIRLVFPALTEERRRETAKDVKKYGEDAKIVVRNARRDMVDDLKKLEKEENLPEDMVKSTQDDIQKLTDKYVGIIDSLVVEKEKEVMTV